MNKLTKIILIIIAVIIVVGLIWLGNKKPVEKGTIGVGVIGHFSGKYADYSTPMKKAVELAVEELNDKGGINNKNIELVIEDDNSSADGAASAINKLVNINNLDYIISIQASGITSVITPVAQKNQRILMITLGSAPELTMVGDYIFRSIPSDSYQAVKMNDFINAVLKSKKVASLYLNDAYGIGIKNSININTKVEHVANEAFESMTTDFRTQLLKIKESGADTLVIVGTSNEYPSILKQIKELKLNVKIIASETFKDERLLDDNAINAEGIYVTFMSDPKDYLDFNNKYQTKFNENPSAYGMYAYDGLMALAKAIDQGEDIDKVKNNLLNVAFDGASGKVGFSKDRDRTGSEYSMYIVQNGKFVLYEE